MVTGRRRGRQLCGCWCLSHASCLQESMGAPTLRSQLLGGGDLKRCGEGDALVRLRHFGDRPSPRSTGGSPDELLVLEQPPALFDPRLRPSPQRLSVNRGTQRPQRNGTHVHQDSGAHRRQRWSDTQQVLTWCRKASCMLASKAWTFWALSINSDDSSVLGGIVIVGGPLMFPCRVRVCTPEWSVVGWNIDGPGADKGRGISDED